MAELGLELLPFDPRPSTSIMVQNLKQRIASFMPPLGYVRWLPDDSKSPLYTCGVRVVKEGSRGKEGYFFCMLGKCIDLKGDWGQGKKLVIGASTSNAISHLREVYNIVGERSEIMMSKKQRVDEIVSKKKRSMETMEASRYWALTVAQTVVHMLWPFNVVEDESFRYLVGEKCPKMSTKMLKRLVLELYIAAKESTMANFIRLKEQTKGLPLFHLNVDLWTCKANGQKFLGVRVYYVDEQFNYTHQNC